MGIFFNEALRGLDKPSFLRYILDEMRIFKTKSFSRFARKEGIGDGELKDMIPQLEANQPTPPQSG